MNENRTTSEGLFERYLTDRALQFEHEPQLPGATRRPDYLVHLTPVALFEVKEFEAKKRYPRSGSMDPYRGPRSKITAAQRQFQAFSDYPCALVLANPSAALVHLDPFIIFGAMLGDLGISMPVDLVRGIADDRQAANAFLARGSMIKYRQEEAIEPYKTRISAVCVLSDLQLGSRLFGIRSAEWTRKMGCTPTSRDLPALFDDFRTELETPPRLRLLVHENPYARSPLPRGFPAGPYDERFGAFADGRLGRPWAGASLLELEAAEDRAGVIRPDPLGLRRGRGNRE